MHHCLKLITGLITISYLLFTSASFAATTFYDLNNQKHQSNQTQPSNKPLTNKEKWLIQKAQERNAEIIAEKKKEKENSPGTISFFFSPECGECIRTLRQMSAKLDKKKIVHRIAIVVTSPQQLSRAGKAGHMNKLVKYQVNMDIEGRIAKRFNIKKLPAAILHKDDKNIIFENDWTKVLKAVGIQ